MGIIIIYIVIHEKKESIHVPRPLKNIGIHSFFRSLKQDVGMEWSDAISISTAVVDMQTEIHKYPVLFVTRNFCNCTAFTSSEINTSLIEWFYLFHASS